VPEEAILSEQTRKDAGMRLGLGGSMHSTDLESGVMPNCTVHTIDQDDSVRGQGIPTHVDRIGVVQCGNLLNFKR